MEKRRFQLEREPGYVYFHGMRVANLAGEIVSLVSGEKDSFDPVLFTGALFHDIGKGFESHNDTGADIARSLLKNTCNDDELDEIDRIVRFHCIRKHGLDLHEKILAVQDADIIDHFGTQEIWLNFLHNSYHDRSQQSVLEWWRSDRFVKHIDELRGLVNLDVSKDLFEERLAYHEEFVSRFQLESEGGIPDGRFPDGVGPS